jgi:ABC-type protease/lipase transport system fused ATPase/permease subunit
VLETFILVVLGFVALVIVGFSLGLLQLTFVVAWKAPLLFIYLVVCFFFPPALVLVPLVGYFWFKAAEIELHAAQLQAQLEAQQEAERFREEMRERMDDLEERQDYGEY